MGWAAEMSDKKFRKIKSGTFTYAPPESLLSKNQNLKSDIWTLGILLYELYMRKEAFQGNNEIEMIKNMRVGQIRIERDKFCSDALKLLSDTLQYD